MPSSATPQTAAKPAKKGFDLRAIPPMEWVNIGAIVLGLTVLGVALFGAWQGLTASSDGVVATNQPTPTPVPSLPALKLHLTHQRAGAIIQAPDQLGRTDPFLKQ